MRFRLLSMSTVAIALALHPGAPLAAQNIDSVVFHPQHGLMPGQRIRISLLGNRWVGELQRIGGDTVFLGPTDHPMGVRFNAIDTLWRRGNYETMASNIGMVTLGLLGAVAVTAIGLGAMEGSQTPSAADYGAVAIGGLAGAGLGWLTGAVIGKAMPRWRRLYPR